ncbi:hypothetical protein CEXT_253141 [Caerostris extrusa]|uniref:Uncharacterized protein n=1 Tax=Caerostris extrusa TaxID=172846 RepID=A0AAV4WVY8_CAEEX|nr:hypothetical protein CEXT_253141 [Caerostris extrusa]
MPCVAGANIKRCFIFVQLFLHVRHYQYEFAKDGYKFHQSVVLPERAEMIIERIGEPSEKCSVSVTSMDRRDGDR